MKYFVFAIDDGTIYDTKVIDIFNKYHIRATFNLNSGLQDFVWYKDGSPVRRLDLNTHKGIYKNHEVASHSLTHPFLTSLSNEAIYHEVKEDVDNLERIFNRKVMSFSFPFDGFDERTIEIIKGIGITHIILPEIDDSFMLPSDSYHIKVTSWSVDDALKKFDRFILDKNAKLFIYLSHSYDYEFANSYDKLEKLCQLVKTHDDIEIITISEIGEETETIETDRLLLRKFHLDDAQEMFDNWASDPEVTKYLTWNPHKNVEETKKILSKWLEKDETMNPYRFAITIKNTGELIGSIDVVDYINGNPEIGYCSSRKHWNNGYMTEVVKAFIEYLFSHGFSKIIIEANENNIGSNRVIEKSGFKFTHKEAKEHCSMFKPEPIVVNLYELNKEE